MSNLFKDKKLNFKEFPSVSTGEWEEIISRDLKGADYKEKLSWNTEEGITALPFYRSEDLSSETAINAPGEWEISQSIRTENSGKAKNLIQDAVNGGADSILLEISATSISSVKDFPDLLDETLSKLTSLHIGKQLSVPEIMEMIHEWYINETLSSDGLTLSFDFDPFALGIFSGRLPEKKEIKKVNYPNIRTLSVACDRYADAGATIVQQLAYALATGNEYLGLNQSSADDIHFNFSAGPYYFLEIAKFRAFRLLWKCVLDEYQLEDTRPYIHAKTTRLNTSELDIHTNLLRTTTEAMSAAVGGCDAITVHRFDDGFTEATPFAQRIARNIQHILAEEAHFDKVSDPGSGSYYIETLTQKLIDESWKLFQEIEAKGGFYECIKKGMIQRQIQEAQSGKAEAVQGGNTVLIGVNKYRNEDQDKGGSQDIGIEEPEPGFESISVETVHPIRLAKPFEEEIQS